MRWYDTPRSSLARALAVGLVGLFALAGVASAQLLIVAAFATQDEQRIPVVIDRDAGTPSAEVPAAELAEALWFEGRVILPANIPADERAFVVAHGHRFSTRGFHRAAVGADGRFRVAFQKDTKRGTIALDARYLALDASFPLKTNEPAPPIELRPQLGAYVRGQCVLAPALRGREAELVGTRVVIQADFVKDQPKYRRELALDRELAFECGGLPTERKLSLRVLPEHAPDVEQALQPLARGKSASVQLELAAGITLRGRVVDEGSRPIPGVELNVSFRTGRSLSSSGHHASADDGSFVLDKLPAGDWIIETESKGRSPARCEPGVLADGVVRDGLVIVVTTGHTIRGHVAWPDGKPAAGATVAWRLLGGSPDLLFRSPLAAKDEVKTSSDGTFAITGLDETACRLHVRATPEKPDAPSSAVGLEGTWVLTEEHTLWHAVAQEVAPGTNDLNLTLKPTVTITGHAVDDAGTPVGELEFSATAVVHLSEDASFSEPPIPGGSERDDGRFALSGLYDGAWDIKVSAEGHTESSTLTIVVPYDGPQLEFKLPRSARVSGRVVDASGKPVAHAKLVVKQNERRDVRLIRTDREDEESEAEGRFELDGLAAGQFELFATAEGFGDSESIELKLRPAQIVSEIELPLYVGGNIFGEAGPARAGWKVHVEARSDRTPPEIDVDARGHFELRSLAPGAYTLTLLAPDESVFDRYPTAREFENAPNDHERSRAVEVLDGQTTSVVLGSGTPPNVHVHGVVRVAGRALAGVSVALKRYSDNPDQESVTAQTDAEGRYAIKLERPGLNRWMVSTPTMSISRWLRIEEGDQLVSCDLPSARISGRVVDPDGKPLDGIPVALFTDAPSEWLMTHRRRESTSTDANGTFSFEGLDRGSYRIQACPDRDDERPLAHELTLRVREGLEIIADSTQLDVELALPRGARITGTVRYADGRPASGAHVFARDANGAIIGWSAVAKTSKDGSFFVENVPTEGAIFFARGVGCASYESAPVMPAADRDTAIELKLQPATRLYARTVDEHGAFVGSVQLRVLDAQGRDCNSVSEPDSPSDECCGNLEATLPPGTYRVVARHADGTSASQTIELAGQRAMGITLHLAR